MSVRVCMGGRSIRQTPNAGLAADSRTCGAVCVRARERRAPRGSLCSRGRLAGRDLGRRSVPRSKAALGAVARLWTGGRGCWTLNRLQVPLCQPLRGQTNQKTIPLHHTHRHLDFRTWMYTHRSRLSASAHGGCRVRGGVRACEAACRRVRYM